ncbi:MAG TPA: helix-turn-helix domain-containing protein [Elusimicrobiota bacterium]|nr:helix-turn-helix domain-containing protein [Elusimicrobiota bacterium]
MTDELRSVGQSLRSRREERRLSVDEMSRTTRIHSRYIQALEEERWGELPAKVYLYGFLQKYAVALGLDPQEVLQSYKQRHEVVSPVEPSAPSVPSKSSQSPRGTEASRLPDVTFLVVLTVLLATLAVFHVKRIGGTPDHGEQSVVAMVRRPNGFLSSTGTEAVNSLETRANTSLRARVMKDHRVVFEGTLIAGTRQKWPIEGPSMIEAESRDLSVSSAGNRLDPRERSGVWIWQAE